ncbi:MAG: transcription-repair coupling factor [Phycisphaeraceae bacterium]|nr:transcription-repair coupling factor [Phycisphaeraceae bacterium]MBX3409253.1 transcription-repair coupling factor [Phycisphaeraceae bacterium]
MHAGFDPVGLVASHPGVVGLARALAAGGRAVASGVGGSAATLTAGAVSRLAGRPVVLVAAHIDDADEAADELAGAGVRALVLPALETLPGESHVSVELLAQRLAVVRAMGEPLVAPLVIVAPIQGLMQLVPAPSRLGRLARTLCADENVQPGELARWLTEAGYQRVEAVEEPGEFALRGGIMDIFPPGVGQATSLESEHSVGSPVRLDFFGDTIDRISEFDPGSMRADRVVKRVDLYAAETAKALADDAGVNFLELVPRGALALIAETMEVVEQGRGYFERVSDGRGVVGPPAVLRLVETRFHAVAELNQFSAGATSSEGRFDLDGGQLPVLARDACEALKELSEGAHGERVVVCCQNEGELQRLGELVEQAGCTGRVERALYYLHRGFTWRTGDEESSRVALVPYHELVGRFAVRRRAARLRGGRATDGFLDFQVGDYVVHADHGIARFLSLGPMKPREVPGVKQAGAARAAVEPEEYLTLEFAGRTKLHVPATQIDRVSKYVGGFAGKPPLSTIGGQKWLSQKQRAAESVRDLAAELLRVRAAREHMPGIRYSADTAWQKEFEAEFPYEETQDQLASLAEIKRDMERARPMDRLVCGDVGFGKTELAIRAAFKACEFGKQVAVLVPTTVLAEQHERTFASRFAGYPFKIASLSRFKSDKEAKEILEEVRRGRVDVLIGTHRILSQDVHFADLGLVIIDEEQRFGVEHKESLLRLRLTVDVLTLSATPIPRTLHMAMIGIRDISSLTTAPLDRRAIVTEVIPYNERRIEQAIRRELAREGQVYFVHNRVYDIRSVADDVQRLAPGARIVIGHGQMPPHELEEVMLKFMRRQADILVSTTIIESGIDNPTANTMIINGADRFGLADLHQLRGRVGRSKHRAYCYLLLPADRTIKEVAQKRLKALEQFSMLGAGFKIAMRDLEIRGAGNILGPEQSGHIAAVGYEMYCQLLERAVQTLQNDEPPPAPAETSIEIGVGGMIPAAYIPSEQRRLEAYRRLAVARSHEEVTRLHEDLREAYGQPPRPVERLFDLAQIRVALAAHGVRTCTLRERDVIFMAKEPERVAGALMAGMKDDAVRVLPPKGPGKLSEVYLRLTAQSLEADTLLAILRKRLGLMAGAGAPARKPA